MALRWNAPPEGGSAPFSSNGFRPLPGSDVVFFPANEHFGTEGGPMAYSTPELRNLGSLSYLTLGQNGSCPDGGQFANQNCGGNNNPNGGGQGNPGNR